ncbi:LON peptidase substrate-binding domain-containing protein [Intrasporangium calvum]|uniref:LON peptidase substrate-binding domain-containing protein n=1 Tax=Intrasporangium calvum TaxID=53358 RepID=A0ABT5GKA1_9MICO|nr:LON peptidase substrate-binding domain-containing protein [Intrasporangium calvum]MDC5698597.1 LON peptidase substrate-binding domain-containing protein [Intrasporangium calvum]
MASLPLFPLGAVLLPGARMPLQVFEPRYVALLRDLIAAQEERSPVFGIIAIREGNEVGEGAIRSLHEVGCAALLTHVAVLGGQRFFIIVEGADRFRLDAVDDAAGTPYLTGEVTWLEEEDGDPAAVAVLAERLRGQLEAFRALVPADPDAEEAEDELPTGARALAYAVPLVVSLELADRQHLLECTDTESRLRLGLELTHRERELAQALGAALKAPQSPFDLN